MIGYEGCLAPFPAGKSLHVFWNEADHWVQPGTHPHASEVMQARSRRKPGLTNSLPQQPDIAFAQSGNWG